MAAAAPDLGERVAALGADPDLVLVPIRHHSPRCALHTRAIIERERPDVVLIEGPSEANHLLPLLGDEHARPPLAVYVYAVGEGAGRADATRFRCFAPLAATSPEWVAIRTAAALGIEARFIDLPYASQLRHRDDSAQPREPLFNDDGLLERADPTARLVAESGARDFGEWWDRAFESGRTFADAAAFLRDMHHFCALLRLSSTIDPQTEAREAFMAAEVRAERRRGRRCVVITGGFHSLGILERLDSTEVPAPEPHRLATGVHIVRYSLERLNSATGYAAGLPDAGYYDLAWQMLNRKREPRPFDAVNRQLVLNVARELRDHGPGASIPDAIEAATLAERLGTLRGVRAGRAELRDAVLAAFVKRPLARADELDRVLDRVLAGDAVGRLPLGVPLAPLVEDFRQQCTRLGLPVAAREPPERSLDLYRSSRHRAISRLLHRLDFLAVPYAERLAGPDFAHGADLDRVREIWRLGWQVETEAVLTERSHLGGSLEEAAAAGVLEALHRPSATGVDHAGLLLASLSMGLHELLETIVTPLEDWLRTARDAPELARAASRLVPAYFARSVLGARGHDTLESLLALAFERFCVRLAWVARLPEAEEQAVCEFLRAALGLVEHAVSWTDREVFLQGLLAVDTASVPPRLDGVVSAVLLLTGEHDEEDTASRLRTAFGRVGVAPADVGLFMEGFLSVARARMMQEPALVAVVTEQVLAWDESEFLDALPAMRLAFAQLPPHQVHALAQLVAGGLEPVPAAALDVDDLRASAALRDALERTARTWGLAP